MQVEIEPKGAKKIEIKFSDGLRDHATGTPMTVDKRLIIIILFIAKQLNNFMTYIYIFYEFIFIYIYTSFQL